MVVKLAAVGFGLAGLAAAAHAAEAAATKETPTKAPDCVYVPTPHDVVEKMLEMANIQKSDVVYDLGCGDGRIVVQAAKKRGCKGVGFEIVPELVKEARENAKKNGVAHLVEIREEDLFSVDFKQATVLPMYLLPGMIVKLTPKLKALKPGTRIVAHDYSIKGMKPDRSETVTSDETNVKHYLYLYTLPLKESEGDTE
jgi:ubiquinone/menaquinone biosynthesis C-methylase UbiE